MTLGDTPQAQVSWLLPTPRIPFKITTRLDTFSGGYGGKESAHNAGDPGSILRSGRSLGEGYGNSLQYLCLENPMDRGARWAIRAGHD